MQVVPFLPASRVHAGCLVLFADLQMEYVTAGRAYAVTAAERCLENCRELLHLARQLRLPIAHFRQLRSESYFNRASRFSQWIDGFRPLPSEIVYERAAPSCYSNAEFGGFIDSITNPTIILAGLSGDQACLSTAIDASHRKDRLIFVSDCSATPSLGGLGEDQSHEAVCQIVARYSDVMTLRETVAQLNRAPRFGERSL